MEWLFYAAIFLRSAATVIVYSILLVLGIVGAVLWLRDRR